MADLTSNPARRRSVFTNTATITSSALLVDPEQEDTREIMDEMKNVICEYAGDGCSAAISRSVKVLISSFMKNIRNDGGDTR